MAVANIGSEAWCRRAYLNYHCHGNSMGLTPQDMGEITQTWSNRLSSWQNSVSTDETEYDFDDSEYEVYKENGRVAAQEAAGHDGNQAGQAINVASDAALGTTGIVLNTIAHKTANKIGEEIMGNVIDKTAVDAGKKFGTDTANKLGNADYAFVITAPLALATATKYMATQPNKDEKEACDALQGEMTAAQDTLMGAQGDMETYGGEIEELSDLANDTNEDANDEIEEQKTEYDMYYETMVALQAKIDAGEELSDSEKELYKSCVGYLKEIGANITELSEDTTDEVDELYDEIGDYQDGFDTAAETMGEAEGLTDFAESIDEATRIMCYVEAASQGLNAVSGGKAAYEAFSVATAGSWFFGATAWAWAFVAMGAAGAAMSSVGVGQQISWAGDVGAEIEMRKATQDINSETLDIYDEQIDYYDGYMAGIEDLELEIPEDFSESLEEVASIEEGTVPGGSGQSGNPFQETPVPVTSGPTTSTGGSKETDPKKAKGQPPQQ